MTESEFTISRRPTSLRVLVENQLRTAIISGQFPPGARLIERELCELFDVGRTSVREALRQLEAEGIVTSLPHRGPMVATVTAEDARQIYDLRQLLEGYCARQMALLGKDTDIAKLKKAFAAFEDACTKPNIKMVIARKNQFYATLFSGACNIQVERILQSLHNRISQLRVSSLSAPGRLEVSVEEVRALVDAISARDPDGAERACQAHIQAAYLIVLDRLTL